MEKNQKSMENVAESQSSSSRRVMWKVREDEEEVFDSVVNYRVLAPANQTNSNAELEMASQSQPIDDQGKLTAADKAPHKSSHESLRDLANKRRARVVSYWHRLFDRLRNQTSPNLALRYKPSHESLKNPSKSSNSIKANQVTADLKLETCFFPPYQTAVVREVAPTFAHRMCIPDDTDSCCSGSIELRVPVLKSMKSNKAHNPRANVSALRDSTSIFSQIQGSNDHAKLKRRNKKTVGSSIGGAGGTSNTSKGSSNKSPSNGSPNCALPTLRQRQQELHHYRVLIEKRRLELLDLKIVRERADALRHEILFHKDLQLKHNQIKSYEDNNSSQA